jgi:hypothetical protein
MAALDAVKSGFLREHTVSPPASGLLDASGRPMAPAPRTVPIPLDEAQRIKQRTYTKLRKSYGELKSAEFEGYKALARGLKEELAAAFPEIGTMNAAESRLLGLEPALERAVRRIANRELLGIGTPIAATAAHAATGSAAAAGAIGVMRAVMDNPAFKSKLAIALHHLETRRPGWKERAVRAAAGPRMLVANSRVQQYIDQLAQAEATLRSQPGEEPAPVASR